MWGQDGLPALLCHKLGGGTSVRDRLGLQRGISPVMFLKDCGPPHTLWAQRTRGRGHSHIAVLNPLTHPTLKSVPMDVRLSAQNRSLPYQKPVSRMQVTPVSITGAEPLTLWASKVMGAWKEVPVTLGNPVLMDLQLQAAVLKLLQLGIISLGYFFFYSRDSFKMNGIEG